MKAVRQSESLFRLHFKGWRILGLLPTQKYHQLYTFYALSANLLITIGYPLHLMIGLFQSTSLFEVMENLSINLTCCVCSLKIIVIWSKSRNIATIMSLMKKQNERICLAPEEVLCYKSNAITNARFILSIFLKFYISTCIFCEMSALFNGIMGSWNLLFPAYFPFDPLAGTKVYVAAHIYQLVGVTFQSLQGAVNDTFAAMHMIFLGGQVRALGMRVSKLGSDVNKTNEENNRELLKCIEDHKDLLRYRSNLEGIIFLYMFCQILITSITMCTIVVIMFVFDIDIVAVVFNLIFLLSITVQILPICYFGTIVEFEFNNLTRTLFASNWLEQDKTFRRNLCIFMENTKKPFVIRAWLFPINLNLFLGVCKNAYSLFALIMNVK